MQPRLFHLLLASVFQRQTNLEVRGLLQRSFIYQPRHASTDGGILALCERHAQLAAVYGLLHGPLALTSTSTMHRIFLS